MTRRKGGVFLIGGNSMALPHCLYSLTHEQCLKLNILQLANCYKTLQQMKIRFDLCPLSNVLEAFSQATAFHTDLLT